MSVWSDDGFTDLFPIRLGMHLRIRSSCRSIFARRRRVLCGASLLLPRFEILLTVVCTKAILTPYIMVLQATKLTKKAQTKAKHFPKRKYAVKA